MSLSSHCCELIKGADTGEKPFACSYPGCGKKFPRPDQLKRHMGVHDGKEKGRGTRKVGK